MRFTTRGVFEYKGPLPLCRVCRLCRFAEPSPVAQPVAVCARRVCTPSRGRRIYRTQGSSFQPLHECERPVPPPASVVCTDNAVRSFSSSTCRCLSARGLYPSRGFGTYDDRGAPFLATVRVREVCARFRECRFVPTTRNTHSVLSPAVVCARETCIHPEGIVCTDPSRRPISRCSSARGLYPFSRESSVQTPRDSLSRFTTCSLRIAGSPYPLLGEGEESASVALITRVGIYWVNGLVVDRK